MEQSGPVNEAQPETLGYGTCHWQDWKVGDRAVLAAYGSGEAGAAAEARIGVECEVVSIHAPLAWYGQEGGPGGSLEPGGFPVPGDQADNTGVWFKPLNTGDWGGWFEQTSTIMQPRLFWPPPHINEDAPNIRVYKNASLGGTEHDLDNICLLYTSPSPRD